MKHVIVLAFLVSVVSCSGSGTETDNPASPLKGFSSSGCKSKPPSPGQQALLRESDADGLTCVEWTRGAGGALDLNLYNFSQACGDTYLGAAAFNAAGALEVSVYKNDCLVHKCGSCVWDFQYQLENVPQGKALQLRIGSAVCESKPTMFTDELTLPLGTQESGVVCRGLDAYALASLARSKDQCGSLNMPCGATCSASDEATCGDGQTCTELAQDDSRCLADCKTDQDCPSGLTRCVASVCQAQATW